MCGKSEEKSVENDQEKDEMKIEEVEVAEGNSRLCGIDAIMYKDGLVLIEQSGINQVSLVRVFSCSNTKSIRDDPLWTSRTRKNSWELIKLPSIKLV